jgi:hypothetical protein
MEPFEKKKTRSRKSRAPVLFNANITFHYHRVYHCILHKLSSLPKDKL